MTWSRFLHDLFTTCSHLDHNLLTSSSWLVHDLLLTCPWLVHNLIFICLWLVQCFLFSFHDSSIIHLWLVYNYLGLLHELWSKLLVIVCDLFMTFLLALDLFSTCSWHIYELFIIFHDSSMACSQLVLKFQHNFLLYLPLSASIDVGNGCLDMRGTSCNLQDTSPSLSWSFGWCHG